MPATGAVQAKGLAVDVFVSVVVLAMGVTCAVVYLRKPSVDPKSRAGHIIGNRPWRRLGGGICLLLSIMFVLGLHFLDGSRSPGAFIAYWLLILVLVMWLCGLAFKDLLYTRRMIMSLRDRLADIEDAPPPPDSADEDRDS